MDRAPDSYAAVMAARIDAAHRDLAMRWLARLTALLPVEVRDVFPTDRLLDHIPAIIREIGAYLEAPGDEELAANTAVIGKAQELGLLRHGQQASVHQILQEYALLGTVLETFVAEETAVLAAPASPLECLAVMRRVGRAVQVLMQITVDTFVAAYIETITQQTERLTSFNRMVSHELRNPLNTLHLVLKLVSTASDAELPTLRERLVPMMQRNLTRMTGLLQSLESLTRAARDDVDSPIVQTIALGSLAGEVARQLTDMAATRGVAIRIAPDLPTVTVDTARLELALMNLVSNAIKYADPAKADRFVEIAPVAAPAEDRVGLAVRDNGLGIPSHVLPDLLHRRFVRAHAARDAELGNDGSGLGLSIVSECVTALGGEVAIASTEGAGTTVTLAVPAAKAAGTP